jgi:hypothetical protein
VCRKKQDIFQKRVDTKARKNAMKAISKFPSSFLSVSVGPRSDPRDQLVQMPRYALLSIVLIRVLPGATNACRLAVKSAFYFVPYMIFPVQDSGEPPYQC